MKGWSDFYWCFLILPKNFVQNNITTRTECFILAWVPCTQGRLPAPFLLHTWTNLARSRDTLKSGQLTRVEALEPVKAPAPGWFPENNEEWKTASLNTKGQKSERVLSVSGHGAHPHSKGEIYHENLCTSWETWKSAYMCVIEILLQGVITFTEVKLCLIFNALILLPTEKPSLKCRHV